MVIANQKGGDLEYVKLPNPTFYFQPDWSPDGKYIAYTDTNFIIWIIDIETKKITKVDADGYAHPNRTMNPKWSPDSDWIAYAKQNNNNFKSIFAYQISTKKIVQITDPIADAITPVWDASGKYIYTLASTDYGLQTGWLDMSSYDPSVSRALYAVVLNSKDKAPVLPKTDEETIKKESEAKKEKQENKKEVKKEDKKIKVIIDENGLFERAVALKLPTSNYLALLKGPKNKVFIAESKPNTPGLTVHSYDVAKEKATVFATGVSSMNASNDRNSILISKRGSWSIEDAKAAKAGKKSLSTNMKVKVDPKAEAHQIFKEGWRFMRDFLYVDNVHGAPWNDVYKWYAPWINDVKHRSDLNYVGLCRIIYDYIRLHIIYKHIIEYNI